MAKLDLYQCMAVAGPQYEDIYCLGQHALADTGQCVDQAAHGGADSSVAMLSPRPQRRRSAYRSGLRAGRRRARRQDRPELTERLRPAPTLMPRRWRSRAAAGAAAAPDRGPGARGDAPAPGPTSAAPPRPCRRAASRLTRKIACSERRQVALALPGERQHHLPAVLARRRALDQAGVHQLVHRARQRGAVDRACIRRARDIVQGASRSIELSARCRETLRPSGLSSASSRASRWRRDDGEQVEDIAGQVERELARRIDRRGWPRCLSFMLPTWRSQNGTIRIPAVAQGVVPISATCTMCDCTFFLTRARWRV